MTTPRWEDDERRLIFGQDASGYDDGRPSYPAELVDFIAERVGDTARVVDIGTGTAKGTRLLAERGMTGVGVEPDPAMGAVAQEHLAAYPGWRIDTSDFEHWTPQDGDTPADLVSAAQSFHWVNPDVAVPKVRDVLRPGGWLMVWWNLADEDPRDVRREIDAVYAEHAPGELFCPQLGRNRDRPLIGEQNDGEFAPAVDHFFRWTLTYTTAELLALLRTHSNHRLMAPDTLARVLDGVAAAVDRHGGQYEYPYVTYLRAIQRLDR